MEILSRRERMRKALSEKEFTLLQQLEQIQEDPTKILKTTAFSSDQWIQYNPEKRQFEYEDNCFLGHSPMDIIRFYREPHQVTWTSKAVWEVVNK